MIGVRLTASGHELIARAASRLRAGRYSRRRFLAAAGALAGALVAGCGREEAGRPPRPDSAVLADLLGPELRAGAAVAGVTGARLVAREDELHARRLARLAGDRRTDRPVASGDLRTALAREQEAVFAYVDALPRLADPDLRVVVMQIAASEAEHLAALRLEAGEEPVPDAFAGYTAGPGG